jgi:tellurite resistance protein TehA-like permease
MLSIYVTRLVNSELPEPSKRPGMYVAVGPAAYTANTLVALGMQAPYHVPDNLFGITSVPVGDIFKVMGIASGIFLWLVAFWFSALTTVSVLLSARESHFTLSHWAFIFPNVGLVVALLQISKALDSKGIKGVVSGATIILAILWFWVAILNVFAVWTKQVLWPGMDEDMEDIEGHGDESADEEGNPNNTV